MIRHSVEEVIHILSPRSGDPGHASSQPMVGLRLLAVAFALLAIAEVVQLIQWARGAHPDPPGLLLTHGLTAVLAGVAAAGLWRGRGWGAVAVLGWGVVMAAMLVTLGPVLDEPRETWRGLRVAAVLVAAFAVGVAWYVRRRTRRPA
jgi:hypothetical protein